jgi:UPF0042 nucleotide-binding protein
MQQIKLVIITGTSGAGKSTALKTFEDLGFFCVDNLPLFLLPKFLSLVCESKVDKVALVMDIREKQFAQKGDDILREIESRGYKPEILFFDAQNEVIIRRFKETRRKHPLAEEGKSITESIVEERKYLQEIRKLATQIIDTSSFSVHDLKRWIEARYKKTALRRLNVHILSFGFKYGLPYEADLVLDVRFLPNPYFVPELKALDGRDERVRKYVMKSEEMQIFLEKILDLLQFLLPFYKREGKNYLNIAIGCTGGKHRSVVVAEALTKALKEKLDNQHEYVVSLTHRDILAG